MSAAAAIHARDAAVQSAQDWLGRVIDDAFTECFDAIDHDSDDEDLRHKITDDVWTVIGRHLEERVTTEWLTRLYERAQEDAAR